jgi:cellulose synthase/poly-beta-1,6-N-acetylglucosamine synthase-like glycosyltransferase
LSRSLDDAFAAASPRLRPQPTPARSLLIHGAVLCLWAALFVRAFLGGGLFAWSAGLVYVAYDTALLVFIFCQTFSLRAAPAAAAGPPLTLGVIIAAHDEAASLPATLAALRVQADPPDLVVIADDGSQDGTAAWLTREGIAAPEPGGRGVRWLRLPHGGKARALNAALERVDTDVVMTVDADTLLEPGAVAAMRAAFAANPALVAATGVMAPVCAPTASGRVLELFQSYEYVRNFLSRAAWARADCLLLISGAFAGFRRDAVTQVGGFDPDCLVEDYELIHRLRRWSVRHDLGWTTAALGSARARTDAPAGVGAFLRQRRRWFGGFLQTQLWYRDMVGDPRCGWLGLAMLPVKAIDTLQPIYGLLAFGLLLGYAFSGRPVFGAAISVVGAKIALDFAFHLWSVHLYSRWTGSPRLGFGRALLVALAEPFSFQLLRHAGAAWGWVAFLSGRRSWGVQARARMAPSPDAA